MALASLLNGLLAQQVVRYFCVGLVTLCLDLSLFWTLVKVFGFHYFWVGAAGFVLTTLVNFELGLKFVFGPIDAAYRRTAMLMVFTVSSIGLVLHQSILYVGVELIRLDAVFAKLVAIAMVFSWNYLTRSRIIFAPSRVR